MLDTETKRDECLTLLDELEAKMYETLELARQLKRQLSYVDASAAGALEGYLIGNVEQFVEDKRQCGGIEDIRSRLRKS
jgi:hypothetical protein